MKAKAKAKRDAKQASERRRCVLPKQLTEKGFNKVLHSHINPRRVVEELFERAMDGDVVAVALIAKINGDLPDAFDIDAQLLDD